MDMSLCPLYSGGNLVLGVLLCLSTTCTASLIRSLPSPSPIAMSQLLSIQVAVKYSFGPGHSLTSSTVHKPASVDQPSAIHSKLMSLSVQVQVCIYPTDRYFFLNMRVLKFKCPS